MLEAMRAYHEVGFDGPFIPDHAPSIGIGSPGWSRYASEAYAMGYIKALVDEVTGGA